MFNFLSKHLLLLSLMLSVSIFSIAYSLAWDLEFAVLGSTSQTLIFAIILERVTPFYSEWNKSQGDIQTDLTSALVLIALVDPLLKFLAPFIVIVFYSTLNLSEDMGQFNPQQLPLVVQIILATLLIELGRYWSHRLHHTVMPLWRLHAMHHSSQRLYAINNLRFNPLNYGLNFFMGILPVMLFGFSAEALFGYLAISQPVLMLQHANINLRSGWLNYIFSTNELHRWHHSTLAHEANSNYGNAIVLWDQIFGTFRFERDSKNEPKRVGLFLSNSNYPTRDGYFKQLVSSLKFNCCATKRI